MRLSKLSIVASLPVLTVSLASAQRVSDAVAGSVSRVASCTVDSVALRDDVTRVYCSYAGRPHTSDRIDGVTLTSGDVSAEAFDIDGVDFRRYFQWEDDGVIRTEIDFPPVVAGGSVVRLQFSTVHGTVTTNEFSIK